MSELNIEQERREFEAWHGGSKPMLFRVENNYAEHLTQIAWSAWLASKSSLIERLQVAEDAANDAERYQFLRSRLDDDKDHGLMEHKKGCDYGFKQGAKLDAAIDAAIAAKEPIP